MAAGLLCTDHILNTKGNTVARKVEVSLVDDYDPTQPATDTVAFGLDGVAYEIDLSDKNAAELRGSLEKWVAVARRVSGSRRRSVGRQAGGSTGLPLAEIREWAQANGHKVSSRGRVSAEIVRAYNAAQAGPDAAEEPAKKVSAKKSKEAPEFSSAGV